MSTIDSPDQPQSACVTCPPPREEGKPWRLADRGYLTCEPCYNRIGEALTDIRDRYTALNPTPGASGESGSRGAPGFGSRSPASDHILCMTDRRSSTVARVWVAADGRVHRESERPPLSVWGVLDGAAWAIAEAQGLDGPKPDATVDDLTRYIDAHRGWLTRNLLVVDVWNDLRALVAQLRPVTGDPGRRHIGLCPNSIDDGEHTRECGARLFAPLRGDEIRCNACSRVWPRDEWLRLGDLLQEAS